MNTYFKYLLVLLLFFLISCKWQSYKEYSLPVYDGALSWTQIINHAEWNERYDHEAVVFNNKLWVLGGYNPGQIQGDTYYEDVWSSEDGISWEPVLSSAPWKGRKGHEVVVFNAGTEEAMYLIGGFSVDEDSGYRQYNNDVWRSTDGIIWTEIKERSYPDLDSQNNWFPRMHHSCITLNSNGTDYIYLIGGRTMMEEVNSRYASKYFNDVWRSSDGISWEKIICNDFGIRSEHAAVTDNLGNIYINGGVHGIIFETDGSNTHPVQDWQALWKSESNIDWSPLIDSESVEDGLLFRSGHQMVFYEGIIWTLPGKTTSNEHYLFADNSHYPLWTFDPSGIWNVDSRGTDIDARHSYEVLVWNGKIWVLGGFTASSGQSNDIWTAEMM